MKKVFLSLLVVLLCCSAVFADTDFVKGTPQLSLKAIFGFDKENSFKLNGAEAKVAAGTDKVQANIGYRYLSDEGQLAALFADEEEGASKKLYETGLFLDLRAQAYKWLKIESHFGYRLLPVIKTSEGAYATSTADEYKGYRDTQYLGKGFYANVKTEVTPVKELTLSTTFATGFKNNELNLEGVNMYAQYRPTIAEKHNFNLLAGAFIATDKDSSGKIFKTSSKTFGRFGYAYDNKYQYQLDSSYFKSYTDSSVEDGLYTNNSFGWTVSNESWFATNVEKDVCSFLKPRIAVSTWSPKENGELTLARVTTNTGLDLRMFSDNLTFASTSYYNHFVDNEEENYLYGETEMGYKDNVGDIKYNLSLDSDYLLYKVDGKVNVADANYLALIKANYKGADWTLNLDYEHSDDNNPEKNRLLTNFEAGYSLQKNTIKKIQLESLRFNAGVNGKYYLQNGSYSKGEYNGYSGSELTFQNR